MCGVPRAALSLALVVTAFSGCECARGRPIAMDCDEDDGICTGVLTPSATGEGVEDIGTLIKGRGDHFVCRSAEAGDHNGKLLMHLVGTGDDPSETNDFVRHACSRGFAAIAPMYENETASRDACDDDDSCFEAFHREIVLGEAGAPDPIDVDARNAITTRARLLLAVLAEDDGEAFAPWSTISARFADGDHADTTVSGHSQGNGHALFFASVFDVDRAILLSGVADRVRLGEPDSGAVSWIERFAMESATPGSRVRSYLHVDEDGVTPVADARDNLAVIGADSGNAIELPAMGCGALAAHISVVLDTFGPRCQLGGSAHSNAANWTSLLE